MFVVVVEFTAKTEHAGAFRQRVQQQSRDSLNLEPDCHVFDVCIDPARAEIVLLYEVYTDRAAFDRHLASDHFRGFDAEVRDWIADKQVSIFTRL